MKAVLFAMLVLTLAGVALAQSPPQPESRPAPATTFVELTTLPFDPAEAASKAEPWFRITFDWKRADATGPAALADTDPASNSQERVPLAPAAVKVPDAVQNLRRAD
jgi:hypothetical protein